MEDIRSKLKSNSTGIEYQKGEEFYKGGFSRCYKCMDLKNKKIFVMKELVNNDISNNEIKIHKSLKHKNIVSYKDTIKEDEKIYIIMEFCENKNLACLIEKRKKLKEIEVQYYILQLINALIYMHKKYIIHRNLKPENLFLKENLELKISDFGIAKKLSYIDEKIKDIAGTLPYIAPEVFEKTGYSFEVDIWAVGVIIYFLIIGKTTFKGSNYAEIKEKIKKVDYSFPKDAIISNAAKDLIRQILIKDPKKRPNLRQILMHDFFVLGRSIPKLIPPRFKDEEPSIEYIRNFMVDADENGIVNKKVIYIDLKNQFPEYKKYDSREVNDDIYVKDCSCKYIEKYGIGYQLSNGNFGVSFRDYSNIIFIPGVNKYYYFPKYKKDNIIIGNFMDKDIISGNHDLQKKIKLLESFMKIMNIKIKDNSIISLNEPKKIPNKEEVFRNKENIPIYIKEYVKSNDTSSFSSLSSSNSNNEENRIFSKSENELTSIINEPEQTSFLSEEGIKALKKALSPFQNNELAFDSEKENDCEAPIYVKRYYKLDNISILLSLSNRDIQIYFFNGEIILFTKMNGEAKFFSSNKFEAGCEVYPINSICEIQNVSILNKWQYAKYLIEKIIIEKERRRLKI